MTLPSMYLGPTSPTLPRAPLRWASPLDSNARVRWRWPEQGKDRVRKLLSRAAMRPIYRFTSLKLGRAFHLESALEHQVAILLDACPTVDWFAEQPVVMEFETPQGPATHIPDFAVAHHGRPWFLELKFARDLDAALIERTQRLTDLLSAVGVGYRLITERYLPGETRLSNAWSLLQRGRRECSEQQSLLAYHQVISTPGISLGELGWSGPTSNATSLARDLMQGRLHTDLALPLSSNSRIWASRVEGGWLWE